MLSFASCAPYPLNPATPPARTVPPPPVGAGPPAGAAPAPVVSPPPPTYAVRAAPPAVSDTCGASQLQQVVGRPRTEIPIPIDPNRQRVACTTCPVALNYDPKRLNFLFDARTGIVREVRCG